MASSATFFVLLLGALQSEAFVMSNPVWQQVVNPSASRKQEHTMRMVVEELPTWEELRSKLPSQAQNRELVADRLSGAKDVPSDRLVLFRDRNGWCPYSERVWLAMMAKRLDFDEVLINLQAGKPSWYSSVVPTGQTPAIRTERGEVVYDSLRVLEFLEENFPETPLLPAAGDDRAAVLGAMNAFSKIMPSGSRPSSRGAFLFKGWGGSFLPASDFEASLDGIESLLGDNGGPFFSGTSFGLADCTWAPFLERWSFQVPAVRPGLHPRDPARWPRLAAWFDAMEAEVDCYLARVKGDRHTWTMALEGAGGGATASSTSDWLSDSVNSNGQQGGRDGAGLSGEEREEVWRRFAEGREGVGRTAREEAARRLWEGRERVRDDAMRKCGIGAEAKADVEKVLRAAAHLLLTDEAEAEGETAAQSVLAAGGLAAEEATLKLTADVAQHLGGRICCPRDMGVLAATALRSKLAAIQAAAHQ